MNRSVPLFSLFPLCGLLAFAAVQAGNEPAKTSFSVAVAGSDTNQGTEAQPFATLERARDAIRALKRAGKDLAGGVEVVVHGGVYPRKGTFTLTREDSGTPEAPVVYRAVAHERPVFFGGTALPKESFVPVLDPAVLGRVISEAARKGLLQCDLKAQGILDSGELSRHGFGTPSELRRPAPAVPGAPEPKPEQFWKRFEST